MPISKYFEGHGSKVARKMRKLYGKDWKRIFYATEKKYKENPEEELDDKDHALMAAFHLAKLEECYAENGEDQALELTNEALDSLMEVIELQDEDSLDEEDGEDGD